MVVMKRWLVVVVVLLASALGVPTAQAPSPSGVLTLIWGDPVDAPGTPQFQILLSTGSGDAVELEFDPGAEPTFDILRRLNGQRVTTVGAFASFSASSGRSVLHVESLRLGNGDHITSAADPAPVFGAQPWITLKCRFADSAGVDRPLNEGLLLGTAYPSPEEYWQQTSYGNITLAGSAVAPWVNLPSPRASYFFASGSANLTMLINDCTAAADSLVNFNSYIGISLMFNQMLDGFWWGGSRSMTLDGTTKVFRTTWAGLTNTLFLSTLMHEYGHGFGFPHSSGPYGQVYDSRWDVMSYAHVFYDSSVGDYVPQGTISFHKDLDGWIPAGRKYLASRNTTATITLERLVLPNTPAAYLMAQIPFPGSTTRFYTVEMRQQVGHDAFVPGNAVIIHNVQSGSARVVDPDNNGNVNDAGAMWTAGETFTDAANQISVRVNSISGQFANVTITSGNPAQRRAPADFDGDGASDLGVFRPADRAWLLRYSSTGGGVTVTWGEPEDIPVPADYDGDNRSDIAVFRPSNATWYISRSTLGPIAVPYGIGSDQPVPADYDGDGKADIAVFRQSTGTWFAIQSGTGTEIGLPYGAAGDLPAPADYDGDGKADFAVFRRSIGTWFTRSSSTGGSSSAAIGGPLDIPVAGDYDGDGLADRAVFQPISGTWLAQRTTGGTLSMVWGQYGDTPVPGDYDADGRTDLAVFRPSSGNWHINMSSTGGGLALGWGNAADVVVPADYGIDHRADIAVFRPTNGNWYVLDSAGGTSTPQWGGPGDIPVPGDYDGDDRADVAVFRPVNGTWYILRSGGGTTTTSWGSATDRPVPADYDGDGKTDIAIYRPSTSTWYIIKSNGTGTTQQIWGTSTDIPMPGDYTGDGKADIATFRPASGSWVILASSGSNVTQVWGNALDVPVAADYDGDGRTDIAVYRPSEGNWYILRSTGGSITTQWGGVRDMPIPADFDADNKADIAVFRAATATWYVLKSAGGTTVAPWGGSADIPLLRR